MIFVEINAIGKDGSTSKTIVNLDKVESISEQKNYGENITFVTFEDSGMKTKQSIDEIMKTGFCFK